MCLRVRLKNQRQSVSQTKKLYQQLKSFLSHSNLMENHASTSIHAEVLKLRTAEELYNNKSNLG